MTAGSAPGTVVAVVGREVVVAAEVGAAADVGVAAEVAADVGRDAVVVSDPVDVDTWIWSRRTFAEVVDLVVPQPASTTATPSTAPSSGTPRRRAAAPAHSRKELGRRYCTQTLCTTDLSER